jgi:hypothetical protein
MSCNEFPELVIMCFGFIRPGSRVGAGSGRLAAPACVEVCRICCCRAGEVDTPDAPQPVTSRAATKQAQIIALLQRPEGAAGAEIVTATSWQPHTVRGAMSGTLKKKLGLTITSEKVADRGRVYRAKARTL